MRAVAVAVLLAALAPLALADEPVDPAAAREHYKAGEQLYDQGKYEEAIAEYEAAYHLKPHFDTLYAIAQAYERLLEFGQSVYWFERFLREAPPDAKDREIVTNRLRVLRGLPARISITSIPERVHARVSDDQGHHFEGDTPAMFKVPAGRYEITLAQPGWESESYQVDAQIGQPYFYQYRLKRSTAPVSIFTRPRGARVFVDERLLGETPFAGDIEVGKHRLLLEHKDYPWHREQLDIHASRPIKLEITLTRPIRSGRTELVLASMVYGGAVGVMLVGAATAKDYPEGQLEFHQTPNGELAYTLAAAAGLGAGFLASFLTTGEGIKVGHSSLIIGGGAWGTSLGTSLGLALDAKAQYIFAMALAGMGVGLTGGAMIARWGDTSPGDAALVNSGGLWGTAAGALMAQSVFRNPSSVEYGYFLLGGTGLGVIAGSLLAWKLEISRAHVALIDVGGLAGTGLGFGLGAGIGYATSGETAPQVGARFALGGMAVGLLAGALLSRKFKGDLPPVEALLIHEHDRWAVGLPSLRIESAATPSGPTPRPTLTLAQGSW
jgi:hypothetical protein